VVEDHELDGAGGIVAAPPIGAPSQARWSEASSILDDEPLVAGGISGPAVGRAAPVDNYPLDTQFEWNHGRATQEL
jgi:hypothetical protein